MHFALRSPLVSLLSTVRTRASLQLEILALRHQLGVLQRAKRGRVALRAMDRLYGDAFRTQAANMAITEVLTPPQSPWQSPYVERLIGSIRRECLDHLVVVNESSLRRQIASFVSYYRSSRCHLSLEKDSPDGRAVEPPEPGRVVAVPMVGGLHHRYERRAA